MILAHCPGRKYLGGPLVDEELENTLQAEFTEATANDALPNIYFNGFVAGISDGDIVVMLRKNNKPIGILNMSFTVAKSLSQSLGTSIAELEKSTGQDIMTTQVVREKRHPED